MKLHSKLLITCAAIASLTACSSAGPRTVQTTRLFADTSGTAAKALQDGETLEAQEGNSAASNLDYSDGNGDTGPVQARFKVKRNADGELTYTVNGVEQVFTTEDRIIFEGDDETYGYSIQDEVNDKYTSLFSHTGPLDETLDPDNTDYLQVWGYQSNQINDGQPDVSGFAVVGTETRSDALGSLPTASYSGRARLNSYNNTGWVNNGTSRTRTRADLSMTADFGAGSISGSLTNISIQDPGAERVDVAGAISMNETSIVGNGYSGALTANAAFTNDSGVSLDASSSYSGIFYGPAAEQTGGTMQITGTSDGSAINGIGYFTGDMDE